MLKSLVRLAVSLAVLAAVMVLATGFLLLDDAPLVDHLAAPEPQDVVVARQFVRATRAAASAAGQAAEPLTTTEADLNSMIRLGGRVVPGFRGRLTVRPHDVLGESSVPVPWFGGTGWLNMTATVPEFSGTFAFGSVIVGHVDVPPAIALAIVRIGGDAALGHGLGKTLVSAATGMRIQGDEVAFDLNIQKVGQNGVFRGIFARLRGEDLPDPASIDRYYRLIREAMDRGELPSEGSYLPYVTFTLRAAIDGSRTEDARDAYTSALFALTRACGARNLSLVVGGIAGRVPEDDGKWKVSCDKLTLNGRIDSRLHFTTAATLQAASNRGFSVSVGEFKELYDTVEASGFDFTDLAANNSGIRMSDRFMSAPPADWPGLVSRIVSENDVIVPFDGIQGLMSGDAFKARFGTVDSPAYAAEIAAIEARIDRLALHAQP